MEERLYYIAAEGRDAIAEGDDMIKEGRATKAFGYARLRVCRREGASRRELAEVLSVSMSKLDMILYQDA